MKVVIVGAKNPETGRMIEAITEKQAGLTDPTQFIGFVDNNPALKGKTFVNLPIFGGQEVLDELIGEGCHFVNTITGSTISRYETTRAITDKGGKLANFVHPTVRIPELFGSGNYIQEAVFIQAGVVVGDNSSVHVDTVIGHESKIGCSTFIAHMVSVSGEVQIGDGVFVGTNATLLPRIKVGNWATIGAGSVVTKDVPDYAVVVGNPAKIIRFSDKKYASGAVN